MPLDCTLIIIIINLKILKMEHIEANGTKAIHTAVAGTPNPNSSQEERGQSHDLRSLATLLNAVPSEMVGA